MYRQAFAKGAEELAERADPTPAVDAATRAMRRLRAEQLDEVDAVVNGGSFYAKGFRSPTDWLVVTTREGVGFCKLTLHLADRIQRMPIAETAFASGMLAESSLRLLAEAWSESVADVFARDEEMLCGWATSMPHADFKLVLDTWRMHADPDREASTAQEQFDKRALHLAKLIDGVGLIDGVLDPEGLALLREAIRLYSQPADGETRSAAQRRAERVRSPFSDRHREPPTRGRQEAPQAQGRRHDRLRRPDLQMARRTEPRHDHPRRHRRRR